jgi:hypothetical protein
MSSLWTDLLFLHGYMTDLKLARRLVEPKQLSEVSDVRRKRSPATNLRAWTARLCLGIGDGEPRTQ